MSDERELITGLRRLAEDTVVPPIDPAQEQRLLAAFDEHQASRLSGRRSPGRAFMRPSRGAIVGLLAAAATLIFAVTRPKRPVDPRPLLAARNPVAQAAPASLVRTPESARIQLPEAPARAVTPPQFVMWPGADDLPRFESGHLMRVELPASVVVSLGLRPSRPLRDDGTVQTDLLVGQDGYARAVRLVR